MSSTFQPTVRTKPESKAKTKLDKTDSRWHDIEWTAIVIAWVLTFFLQIVAWFVFVALGTPFTLIGDIPSAALVLLIAVAAAVVPYICIGYYFAQNVFREIRWHCIIYGVGEIVIGVLLSIFVSEFASTDLVSYVLVVPATLFGSYLGENW